MAAPFTRSTLAALSALALAIGVSACGGGVATSSFKGESHAVAETIASLQTNATDADYDKICEDDLAAVVKSRLERAGSSCKAAMESQVGEIDTFEVSVKSVKISGDTATATVKSIQSGKDALQTLLLVKEGQTWKVSGVGS